MPSLQSLLDQVEAATNEIVELERSLVKIPSVNVGFMPTGGETAVAEFMADWLRDEGLDSEILARDPDRGNLISVYPGDDNDTRLMLMSHSDVVPVEDETKWNYEPFGAEISEGRIYGRGSNDCKALLTCQLMAMAIMKRSGVKLDHGLRLVSGADEEHGGRWGFGWLADNHPESLKSQFAVNEGGGTPVEMGNSLTYLLGTGEKGRMELHITLRGESAHASVPWTGVNASYRLSRTLNAIENYRPELDTSLEIFDHVGKWGIEEKPSPMNIDRIVAELGETSPRLSSMLRALSRLVLTPTMMKGGIKSNSVPEEIKLTCD
ncbi:MAG: M20/M25/M40 family metallo-hydrolase, partial [Chloroflexota bacterium]